MPEAGWNTCGRYEELKRQLAEAQEAAQIEDEEAELARAADALARLTAPTAAAAAAGGGRPAKDGAAAPSLETGGDGGSASGSKRVPPHSHPLGRNHALMLLIEHGGKRMLHCMLVDICLLICKEIPFRR